MTHDNGAFVKRLRIHVSVCRLHLRLGWGCVELYRLLSDPKQVGVGLAVEVERVW